MTALANKSCCVDGGSVEVEAEADMVRWNGLEEVKMVTFRLQFSRLDLTDPADPMLVPFDCFRLLPSSSCLRSQSAFCCSSEPGQTRRASQDDQQLGSEELLFEVAAAR